VHSESKHGEARFRTRRYERVRNVRLNKHRALRELQILSRQLGVGVRLLLYSTLSELGVDELSL
jgi:hypothetical protein